ncbi:MAG TPA: aspartate/glutamate racemase family protein [Thermoanaerobaculia bacterium]|jgi:aspartate racemase
MGPLASAAFLGALYRLNLVEPEQETPSCVLLSDPTFPDRTEAILAGSTGVLVERLEPALRSLLAQGADRIVIACVTIHHVLPSIPEPLRRKVISLLDLMVDEILAAPRRRLLLATTGTRTARIFESHERWSQIEPWVVFPGEEDQRTLHEWIYHHLKAGSSGEECLRWIDSLAARYDVRGFLFGCTELHLLQDLLAARPPGPLDVIDPLWTVARDVRKILRESACLS